MTEPLFYFQFLFSFNTCLKYMFSSLHRDASVCVQFLWDSAVLDYPRRNPDSDFFLIFLYRGNWDPDFPQSNLRLP